MGIRPLFTPAEISARLKAKMQAIDKAIVFRLSYLGEECVNEARKYGSYRDQTGNLRNSVGYIVQHNGEVVKHNFKSTVKGGELGVSKGQSLAERIGKEYTDGYVLIVVAGMSYASHVEASGRNVLVSAEQYAKIEAPGIIKKLKSMIK